jgi:hypothetical protein
MKKSIFCVLSVAVVLGAVLTSTAASAAVTANARASSPAAGDPDTTVTFAVTAGLLSMTAPVAATLATGTGAPGTIISGLLGGTVVTDDRALLTAAWTVDVSSTDFLTGGGTPAETIAAGAATYTAGGFTTTGTITVAADPATLTLSGISTADVTGTAGVGNNTATWTPTIAVTIPDAAVAGAYTATLTQSVA